MRVKTWKLLGYLQLFISAEWFVFSIFVPVPPSDKFLVALLMTFNTFLWSSVGPRQTTK